MTHPPWPYARLMSACYEGTSLDGLDWNAVQQRVVVPYDPEWPLLFERERVALEATLGPWLLGGIHHIGSTAVPGLHAKPVIDMIAGVRELDAAREAFEPLEELGYWYREHRPDAHLLWRPEPHEPHGRTYGVHLTEPGSDLWRERLAFRDALRVDASLAAKYGTWKLRHAAGTPDPPRYTADKRPFVARVLAGAGIDLKPDSERLTAGALARRGS